MYKIIKSVISSGNYKLTEMQHRIKKLYVMGNLSETEMDELIELSQRNATADSERPELLDLIQSIDERLRVVEELLINKDDVGNESDPDDNTTTYEAWTPWDGISNEYQPGAIVTHNGKVWQSVHTGQNTWEPGVVGTEALWVEYAEA